MNKSVKESRSDVVCYSFANLDFENHSIPYWRTFIYLSIVTSEAFIRKLIAGFFKKRDGGFMKSVIKISDLKYNSVFFDGLSSSLMFLRKNSASYASLDLVYNWGFGPEKVCKEKGLRKKIEDIAFNCKSSLGVRNRLKLVKSILLNLVLFEKKRRIVSIAAGSGEAVLNAMHKAVMHGYKINVLFIDIDKEALLHAEKIAKKLQISENVTFLHKNIFDAFKDIKEFEPDVIEMTGIIDYFSNYNLEKFLKIIRRFNADILTSNIVKKCGIIGFVERYFLMITSDWLMFYRDDESLRDIFNKVGLNAMFETEPMGMYTVIFHKNKKE